MVKLSNPTATMDQKNKKKKKKNSGPKGIAMKVEAPKPNPFETIWSRRKFDILGKKRKGEERRIGLARSIGIEKRKKTLLKEYEQSSKSSVFVDRRIGEQDDALPEFDKGILRSQRHRQMKLTKKSKFNLSDGEEDEGFEFEGLGALSERDDFEDEMFPDDDDHYGDATEKESAMLKQLHAHKTQNPLESGMNEGDENVRPILLSYFWQDLVNKSIPNEQRKKDESSTTQKIENLNQDQPDSYDKLVKAMALEMRARPSDRTKTPEEIAQEEREQLEHLEEERQKRMLAPEDASDEDNDDSEKPSTQRLRPISGDALGDSFSLEEEPRTKKGWVDEILERRNENNSDSEAGDSSGDSETAEDDGDEEGSDEDNEEGENNLSLKDWEQSDDDDLGTDLEDDEEEEEEEEEEDDDDDEKEMGSRDQKKAKKSDAVETTKRDRDPLDAKKMKVDGQTLSTRSDLPYLIEAPKSLEELCALLDNRSNTEIMLIINRIRASNAIKLAAENRKKMQVFYGVLLQYFATLANKKPLNFEILNLLVKPLMEMSVEIPYFAAICARQSILRTRTQFCEIIKDPEISSWPSSKMLFLLRLWSMIFPCSDFRHVVMTPAILLMCEYLMRCPIMSGRDIAIGSFLCSMLLSLQTGNQFHVRILSIIILLEFKALGPLLCIRDCVDEISPLNFIMIMDMPENSPFFSSDNFRVSVLLTMIETLQGYVNIYEGYSSFPEIFVKGRDYDPDRERAEKRKLKKLVKREAKGAARELRKDASFLLEVKEKERALREKERAEKYGKALAFLQEQEHNLKSGQLGKGRKRSR
uniref:Nucleolar protein 14 n=1 Tax=Fagus sylvatica TaxID=28930 RepID=A0A2N9HSV5_FAGSY